MKLTVDEREWCLNAPRSSSGDDSGSTACFFETPGDWVLASHDAMAGAEGRTSSVRCWLPCFRRWLRTADPLHRRGLLIKNRATPRTGDCPTVWLQLCVSDPQTLKILLWGRNLVPMTVSPNGGDVFACSERDPVDDTCASCLQSTLEKRWGGPPASERRIQRRIARTTAQVGSERSRSYLL